MKTVKEVSRVTGVSVRALHHYDTIGLLKPTRVTEAGYRLYDEEALRRLHSILLFRELGFALKDIRNILDSPDFDPMEALERQIGLLELQRQRLDRIIAHARKILKTGGISMDFTSYDRTDLERYAAQAREKWGSTPAYREFEQKNDGKEKREQTADAEALMAIFTRMGAIRNRDPGSAEAQELVKELRGCITERYYTCTREILRCLGKMYAAGDEMTENIDRAGGPGTAVFAHKAIEIYCAD